MPSQRDRLRKVSTFPSLVKYLQEELDWPIGSDDFEDDLTFDYSPEELGLDPTTAAKIDEIKRLRPLTANQPWGIFFVKFEPKRLPVIALRRILNQVVTKKRASANTSGLPSWEMANLILISSYGGSGKREISFAHFTQSAEGSRLPELKVLGWDSRDTALHLDHVADVLAEQFAWPDDEENTDAWLEKWRSAFTLTHREVVTTSQRLSVELAKLALNIRDRINTILAIESDDGPLTKLLDAFRQALVHDLEPDDFADMYAQTITYGLLSSRIANPTGSNTSGSSQAMGITNPFLRELLEELLGIGDSKRSLDSSLNLDFDELGVGEVVELLNCSNMEAVVLDFGDENPEEDPVIHFYELFLTKYDPKKRMQRGVFYTPRPVVSFIVRSVDELLRTQFDLEDGLGDTATWAEMTQRFPDLTIPEGTPPEQPFVQILDPATGTGTFLVEVVDLIHKTMTDRWRSEGHNSTTLNQLWNQYVPQHLLPRLHGYELLMAPYAIAHLKIGIKLYETGYRFGTEERVRIYLTNALEPSEDRSGSFDFDLPALSHEVTAVNQVKADLPFTVVIGNPPYSGTSSNTGDWITQLVKDYYYINGQPLGERNPRWLLDDYVKFLRLGQSLITNAGIGVLSFITNHSYIDNPTFRGFRQQFAALFNNISIVDLHGNLKKKETTAAGTPDENVFDIQQGVAICTASISPATERCINHVDVFGAREFKYQYLLDNSLNTLACNQVASEDPFYPLKPYSFHKEYEEWESLVEVMPLHGWGIATRKDSLLVDFSESQLATRFSKILTGTLEDAYDHGVKDTAYWQFSSIRDRLGTDVAGRISKYAYRPFDNRWVFYEPLMIERGDHRWPVARHMLKRDKNLSLLVSRTGSASGSTIWDVLFVADCISDLNLFRRGGAFTFPLYLLPDEDQLALESDHSRTQLNLSDSFLNGLSTRLDLEKTSTNPISSIAPETVIYYIYALLHSPEYRSRYSDHLSIDFPRIPLPLNRQVFDDLSHIGNKLVKLHLLRVARVGNEAITPIGDEEFLVEKVSYSNSTVWINKAQTVGFSGISENVWAFSIGGYQVCEKWLKDRQAKGGKSPRPGRVLSVEDVAHYKNTVVTIAETIRLMEKIDGVIKTHGGWPAAFSSV